jgi:acyl-CoA hydrolase
MTTQSIVPQYVKSIRYVKSENLNHHGTLFAGTIAEWLFEAAFFTATTLLKPKNLLFLKINEMNCYKPVYSGSIIHYKSKLAYTGKTSLTIYIIATEQETNDIIADGFVTYVHVNDDFKAIVHNLELVPQTEEDKKHFEIAKGFKKR